MLAPSRINGEWKGVRGIELTAREGGCAPFCSGPIFLLSLWLRSGRNVHPLPACPLCVRRWRMAQKYFPYTKAQRPTGDESWRDGDEEKQGKLKYSFESTTVDILHETPPV